MITVNTPDGGTAQFPDDTPTDTITSAMKAKFGGPDGPAKTDGTAAKSDDSYSGIAGNTAYRAANTGTLGALDYGLAGVHALTGGDDLATIRAKNEDFANMHPVLSLGADVAGYGLGFGKLGLAAKGAELAAGLGAGAKTAAALGAAGEGAVAGGVGSALHGDSVGDSIKDAMLGGAVGGTLGRVIGVPGAKATAAKPLAGLEADADAAYANLKTKPVSPNAINMGLKYIDRKLTPSEASGISDKLQGQLDDIGKALNSGKPVSANDLDSMARQVMRAQQKGPGSTDSVVGSRVGELLRSFYSKDQEAARTATARLGDTKMLSGFDTGLLSDVSKAPAEAARRLDDNRFIYDTEGQRAMEKLRDSGEGGFKTGARNAAAFGINKGIGALGGHYLGGLIGESGIGTLLGLQKGTGNMDIGHTIASIGAQQRTKRAIKAALAATSTGKYATGSMYRRPAYGVPLLKTGVLAELSQ